MTQHTSATGGYLLPLPAPAPQPLEDASLVAFFQGLVVGLTGLDGTLVRPRWQPVMPTPPDNATTWAAVGIHSREAEPFAYEIHDPSAFGGLGGDIVQRNESLEVLCSVYGPSADTTASLIRDGLGIRQNLDYATAAGLTIINVGAVRVMSTVINTLWYYRLDVPIYVRRVITRTYPILTIVSGDVTIHSSDGLGSGGEIDTIVTQFSVEQ